MEIIKDPRPIVTMIFLPGLYLCLFVSAAFCLLVPVGLITILYRNHIHFPPLYIITILITLGGLVGAFCSVEGGRIAIQNEAVHYFAINITKEHAPVLFEMIKELCCKMRTAMPDNIILELGTSFFVTEGKVKTFDGEHKSRTLCLSAPMMHLLSPRELKSIIVHELAHFTGEDTAYSKYFCPIYKGTLSALNDMDEVNEPETYDSAWMSVALIIPKLILRAYLALFTRVERRIGRQRELRADSLAAKETTTKVMASALVKLDSYGTIWDQVSENWIVDKLNEGRVYRNLSALFATTFRPEKSLLQERAKDLSMQLTHPTDSHPRLKDRLAELGENQIDVFNTEGETAASLFPDLASLEERLTEGLTLLIAQYHPRVDREKLLAL